MSDNVVSSMGGKIAAQHGRSSESRECSDVAAPPGNIREICWRKDQIQFHGILKPWNMYVREGIPWSKDMGA